MKTLRFFGICFRLTLGKFCRQRWLLAGLILLCVLLPLAAGQAAGRLLSRGVDFSGVTLAISAPEGDDTPALLEQYMGGMEDISQYCTVLAMEEEEALSALGFSDFRVRLFHGAARLQVTRAQLPLALEKRTDLLAALGSDFSQVLLDLEVRP